MLLSRKFCRLSSNLFPPLQYINKLRHIIPKVIDKTLTLIILKIPLIILNGLSYVPQKNILQSWSEITATAGKFGVVRVATTGLFPPISFAKFINVFYINNVDV